MARSAANRAGWIFEELHQQNQWRVLRTEINTALRWAWREWWHSDVMRVNQLTLRADWSAATTYAAGDEVYHGDSDAYYVALQASTNEAPASLSGTTWLTNYTYWARQTEEPASVDQGDWSLSRAYVVGNRVTYHDTDYACIQAHTSSASILPTNTSYWAAVPDFDWTEPYYRSGRPVIGRVARAATLNPRLYPGACRIEFDHAEDGIRFLNSPVTRPWIEYRIECPQLTGDEWGATTAYTEESDNKAVYGK